MKYSTISIGLLLLSCVLFYTACKKDQNTLAEELTDGSWRIYSMVNNGYDLVNGVSGDFSFSFEAKSEQMLEGVFVHEFGPDMNTSFERDTLSVTLNSSDSTLLLRPCLYWVFACTESNLVKIRRFSGDTLVFDGTDEANNYTIFKAVRE